MNAIGNVRVALVNISVSGSLVMVLLKTNSFFMSFPGKILWGHCVH